MRSPTPIRKQKMKLTKSWGLGYECNGQEKDTHGRERDFHIVVVFVRKNGTNIVHLVF